jgi:hypothetical protein
MCSELNSRVYLASVVVISNGSTIEYIHSSSKELEGIIFTQRNLMMSLVILTGA